MAEPLVVESPKTDDFLVGTAEEFSKRMESEPGFYKIYEKKYDEGKIKVISKDEPVLVVEKVEEKTPEVKVETPPVEEEISVKIKKSDLGRYESIGDLLKGVTEKDKFIEHLKSQVTEVNSKMGELGQTKAEFERLKNEKVELEKKIATVTPVTVAQASALAEIKLPSFDNLNGLTDEQLQEKLYEAETLKKVVEGVRQSSKIIEYNKTLESKIDALTAQIKATSDAQAKMSSSYEEMTKMTQEKSRVDSVFNNVGELQNKFDELRTKIPVRDLDSKYTKFAQDLGMLEKKYDSESIGLLMDKFFNDPSTEGDALRQKAETLGVRPPEDVDKYLAIRKALDIADQTKLPLDEAYALHQYKSGGLNKLLSTANTEEAKRREEALKKRESFAKVADNSQSQPTPVPVEGEEKMFAEMLALNIPFSEVKRDPEKKRLYDKFYGQAGIPIDWNKY